MRSQYVERTSEIENAILERLAKGEFLATICAEPGMPNRRTVTNWKNDIPEFGARYKEARDDGFDERAEKALLGLYASPGVIVDESGRTRIDPAWVALVKVQFWGEMEMLKRWDPERYSERIGIEHSAKGSIADLLELARGRILAAGRTMPEASK